MSEPLAFNGINGATGGYLLPRLSAEDLAGIARGDQFDALHLEELRHRYQQATGAFLGVREGIDPTKIAEAGWGVVFAHADRERVPGIRKALQPLLDLRRSQAGRYYREFDGPDAYRPGQSKSAFLARHQAAPGQPADPEKVPYYLLLVGEPASIPFKFQYQLDVEYAVGRLCFDELEAYERYARGVVAAESGRASRSRTLSMFGVENDDDRATQLSASQLVRPLADSIARAHSDWKIDARLAEETTKHDLTSLLQGTERPALLFTASHGMGFPNGAAAAAPRSRSAALPGLARAADVGQQADSRRLLLRRARRGRANPGRRPGRVSLRLLWGRYAPAGRLCAFRVPGKDRHRSASVRRIACRAAC